CEHFAARLSLLETNTADRVEAAFRLTLGREPNPDELHDFVAYADQHGLENLCRVILNLNEFIFVN
ncbi:MAG: hypothetical protein ABL888_21685, partial [Pirellulaceae bacterium]